MVGHVVALQYCPLLISLSDMCGCCVVMHLESLCNTCHQFLVRECVTGLVGFTAVVNRFIPSWTSFHSQLTSASRLFTVRSQTAVVCPVLPLLPEIGIQPVLSFFVPEDAKEPDLRYAGGRSFYILLLRLEGVTIELVGHCATALKDLKGTQCLVTAARVSRIHGSEVVMVRSTKTSLVVPSDSPHFPFEYRRRSQKKTIVRASSFRGLLTAVIGDVAVVSVEGHSEPLLLKMDSLTFEE